MTTLLYRTTEKQDKRIDGLLAIFYTDNGQLEVVYRNDAGKVVTEFLSIRNIYSFTIK